MALTVVAMGSSADRSGANVALPILLAENIVGGNGVPGTGTTWYPKFNSSIVGTYVGSETAAMVECRWRKTTDANYQKMFGRHLQTATLAARNINYVDYPVTTGDQIECNGENAGAVLDVAGFWFNRNGSEPMISPTPLGPLPKNAIMVHGIATMTHVADSWSPWASWVGEDFTPQRDTVYRIIGMSANSATGILTRLQFIEGPNVDDYPGVPCGDAAVGDNQMMWFGDFGQFKGANPPLVQTAAVGADSQTCVYFILVPQGSK